MRARDFSTEDLRAIENKILHTGRNIFNVANGLTEEVIVDPDTLFDIMRERGVLKCEECGTWKTASEMASWNDELCAECEEDL